MRGFFRAVAVALTSLAIALSGATAASASKTSGTQEMGFFDRYLIDRVNYARVEQGLEPLVFHDPLRRTALNWSREMAHGNFFDHGNTQAHSAPSGCTYVGEAIGYAKRSSYNSPVSKHPDPQRQFDRYRASAPHWAILMRPNMKYIASGTIIDWGSNKVLNTVRVAGNCSGGHGSMPEVDANLWPVEVANPLFRFVPDMSKKGRTSPYFGDNGTPSLSPGTYASSNGTTAPTQQPTASARFIRMPDPVPIPDRRTGVPPMKTRPEYGSTSFYTDGGEFFTTTPGTPDPGQVFADDWNGDGRDEPIVRHGNTFYNAGTHTPKAILSFGRTGDEVFAGNWGHGPTGEVNFAVRRGNVFYLNDSKRGGVADRTVSYGRPDDELLIGDWDGDGVDTPAVRRGNLIYIKNDWSGGVADHVFAYGRADDELVAGDFDGDGSDSISIKRGHVFHINNRLAGGAAQYTVYYGRGDTFVIVGDFNGDGMDTLAGALTW